MEKTLTHVCSLDYGEKIARLDGHNQDVFAIAPSSDETKVVTASIDGQVNVYDTNNWNIGSKPAIHKIEDPTGINKTNSDYLSWQCCILCGNLPEWNSTKRGRRWYFKEMVQSLYIRNKIND